MTSPMRAWLPPIDAIPFYVDARVPEVYFVRPTPHNPLTFGRRFEPVGYFVGSMPAWGALFAHNLAAAYKPEGVP